MRPITKSLVMLEEHKGVASVAYHATPEAISRLNRLGLNPAKNTVGRPTELLRSEVFRMRAYAGSYPKFEREMGRYSVNASRNVGVGYSSDNEVRNGLFWVEKDGIVRNEPMFVKSLDSLKEAVSEDFAAALRSEYGKDGHALLVPHSNDHVLGENGLVTLTQDSALYWMYMRVEQEKMDANGAARRQILTASITTLMQSLR